VVIGYGTARRGQVVGSVGTVTNEEITRQPVLTAVQGLQGMIAGVQVISSGSPGSQPVVRIRGTNSITAGGDPIYVVDGNIVGDITNINSSDIESVVILKDAASQAIYGSRGSNGVILLTTKTGKSGKIRVNLDTYAGFRSMTSKVEMADAQTYAQFTNEARAFDNQAPMFGLDTLQYNTDWFDAITRKGFVQNYTLTANGGTEVANYYFSASYFKDEGILKGNDYSRLVIRNSNDYKLTKFLRFGHTVNFSYLLDNMKPNVFTDAYRIGSTAPVRYPDGNYGYVTGLSVSNPVAAIDYTNNFKKGTRFLGNAYLELSLFKGLTIRSSINFDRPEDLTTNYTPVYRVSSVQQNATSSLNIRDFKYFSYIFDNNATYAKTFADVHEVKLIVGYSAEHSKETVLTGIRQNVPNQKNLWYLNQGDLDSQENSHEGYLEQRASFYGRLTYTFDNRYNVSGVLRRDGSSNFPVNEKWGTFPSIGVSWIVSRESFMKNQNIFDELKLRGSYGIIGNDRIPQFTGILIPVSITGPYYLRGLVQGITEDQIKDATVTWETTEGIDFGIEMSLIDRRLTSEITYFNKITEAYVPTNFAGAAGDFDGTVYAKAANVRNKGFELAFNWKDTKAGNFTYHAGINITLIDNNVEKVTGGLAHRDGGLGNGHITTKTVKGEPIGSFWVYKTIGIYQSVDEVNATPHLTGAKPGDFILADINGDGVLDEGDRRHVGSYQPKSYFGANLGFEWKQLDLAIDCYGNMGNKIFNGKKAVRFGNDNIEADRAKDRWTIDNPGGSQPRASNAIPAPSDYFIESGDFFRINNITLGYSIPVERWGNAVSRFRIFATAQNPLILKKYSGFTPELPGERSTSSGIELGVYPVFSTYMMGLNLSF